MLLATLLTLLKSDGSVTKANRCFNLELRTIKPLTRLESKRWFAI